jgi:hypothetical protein
VIQSQQEPEGLWSSVLKLVAAPVVVVVLGAAALAALDLDSDGGPKTGTQATSENRGSGPNPVEEVNQTAPVADFVVTIRSYECGVREFNTYKAKGEFCVFRVKVDNRGNLATYVDQIWILYVGDKRFPATSSIGPGFSSLFPDDSGEGEIAFDVPIGNSPTKVVLGMFSDSPSIMLP